MSQLPKELANTGTRFINNLTRRCSKGCKESKEGRASKEEKVTGYGVFKHEEVLPNFALIRYFHL